ncbi:hypothetical protein N7478_001042 [Penicillium angulare]|uniref:uncharacterized protein n=1 Tax=Penicillium angulare TaxID=116970 RepID=UPI0025407635|nr:uncharacterized protein N7478_001042 [Penicillium angulare]KAJ5291791.1 hypothetical protein N7478_001042 [Penicillium angulare]
MESNLDNNSPSTPAEDSGEGAPAGPNTRHRRRARRAQRLLDAQIKDAFLTFLAQGQAKDLPDIRSVNLREIHPTLNGGRKQCENWLGTVNEALFVAGLRNLIDKNVRRPLILSQEGDVWARMSRMVKSWLERSLGPHIRQRILDANPETELIYADSYMAAAMRCLVNESVD